MHMTLRQASNMDRRALEQFLDLKIGEGQCLDYKVTVNLSTDENKREFLKDISAFANSAGGHVIIGCKEPTEAVDGKDQIVGVEGGEAIARQLEQLAASCLDPRIPGLQIFKIDVQADRSCILVHVPASFSRPHMVNHQKSRAFYRRHSESSFLMTTHEIRESVLTAATAGQQASQFMAHRKREVLGMYGTERPLILIQAMPLIAIEEKWDVLSEPFKNIIRGHNRVGRFRSYDLASTCAPIPTIDGIAGVADKMDPEWRTEIHRNGYVSVLLLKLKQTSAKSGDRKLVVHSGYGDLFKSFCFMLTECLEQSGVDLPYIISCVHECAGSTYLWTESSAQQEFTKYPGHGRIQWPEHIRETGQDPVEIADVMLQELFYAFGHEHVRN